MKALRYAFLILIACVCRPLFAATPTGLIDSSRQMIDILKRVETKLVEDQKALDEGFRDLVGGAQTAVDNVSDFHKQRAMQRVSLASHGAWDDARFREMVLYGIAEVSLSVDDLAAEQMREVRSLEDARQAAMKQLIKLVRALHENQQELVNYLADQSARKRLGELNVNLLATSIAETNKLRNALDGASDADVDVDAQRAKLQKAVDNLDRLLEFIGR